MAHVINRLNADNTYHNYMGYGTITVYRMNMNTSGIYCKFSMLTAWVKM